ncbi:MAG TPA: Vms1/Ankzf1 family peptidyl-tRNA hydrolase [Pyrinomonadaceae bacterium]|jgi:peptide chain release factor subunit 1
MSLEHLVEKLAAFEPQGALPIVSLYLNAQADEHGRHNFYTFVRKQIPERAKTYEPDTPERESLDADFVRINRYLEQDVRSNTQGIAIFACSGANNFFEPVQLEVPIENNRLFIYDHPHLYPLARLLDQYQRYAVVLADTNVARIFVFALGRAIKHSELQNVKTKRTQVGGWSQMRFQRHIENYHLHHAKEVIDVLERLVRDERIEHVMLAGDEETIIPLLRQQMSKELSAKVIDVLRLGIDTSERELLEESLIAYRRYNSLSDMEKVDHLLHEYRADGLAVVGVPQTLAALSNGQVEELLITASPDTLQFDNSEVEKVLAAYGKNEEEIRTLDQRTVADELIKRATELSSARVTFIEDNSVLKHVGGVGALLRYRVSDENAAPYEQGQPVSTAEAMLQIDSSREGGEDVGQGSTKERSQAKGQG